MAGRVDLFHSRRANYERCDFWLRDERNRTGTPSEWIRFNKPAGSFYARPVNPKSQSMDVVNGVWALDGERVAIETDDDVEDLCRGCWVRYQGQIWIVESVQRTQHHKESEFAWRPDWRYTVSMAKGG